MPKPLKLLLIAAGAATAVVVTYVATAFVVMEHTDDHEPYPSGFDHVV